MNSLTGKKKIWIAVAIVIIVLVGGIAIERTILAPQPSLYQTRLNQIESQGYTPQQAAWIASSNVTVMNSNSTYADTMVSISPNVTAEVIIDISANQSFTPTQGEIDNTTIGVYNMTFTYGNTSFGQELNVSYFTANSELIYHCNSSPSFDFVRVRGSERIVNFQRSSFPSLPLSREPGYTLLNGGGSVSHNVFHVLEQIKVGLNSIKAIGEALAINQEYTIWLKQLNELQDCAENPTNPLTISGYQQDPGQEQKILDQITSAKAQLAELTIARFLNLAVSLGAEIIKDVGADILALLAENFSEETLKQLSEEQVQSIEKLVTPCGTTTTSNSTTQSLRTVTLSTYTPTRSAYADFYGNFQYTLDAGNGYVESASGSFSFSIDPSTYSIIGSGKGFVTDKLSSPSPCSASGSGSYTFTVNGTYATYDNNLSLEFGNANPPTVMGPETCPGPPSYVETATWPTAAVMPPIVIIAAVDGATVSCPPTCFGTQTTYQITVHAGQAPSTESTSQTTTTEISSTSTSSETTSTEDTSSTISSYTITVSTSNSTSTSR